MQEPDHFAKLPILPGGCIKANDPQIQRPVRRTTQGVPQSLRDWVQIPRGLFTRRSPTGHTLIALFLLLAMESVLPQTRAILFDAKFLSAGLSPDGIVVVAALFTHEKNRFSFLLTSGHREGSGYRLIWAIWKFRVAIIAVERPFRQVEMTTLATFLGSALLKNRRISRLRSRKSFEKPILTTSQLLL